MFEKYQHLLSKSPFGSIPCLIPETNAMLRYLPSADSHPHVIDVCCGQGGWTNRLTAMGYKVVAVDLDTSQFSSAIKADMHELPFDDNSFDVVFCTGSFEHAFAPFIVLSEFCRVLVDGGVILITLPMPDNVKMLQDAGHYNAISKLQMQEMYCSKLNMKIIGYESGEYDTVVGPHQIFAMEVSKK